LNIFGLATRKVIQSDPGNGLVLKVKQMYGLVGVSAGKENLNLGTLLKWHKGEGKTPLCYIDKEQRTAVMQKCTAETISWAEDLGVDPYILSPVPKLIDYVIKEYPDVTTLRLLGGIKDQVRAVRREAERGTDGVVCYGFELDQRLILALGKAAERQNVDFYVNVQRKSWRNWDRVRDRRMIMENATGILCNHPEKAKAYETKVLAGR